MTIEMTDDPAALAMLVTLERRRCEAMVAGDVETLTALASKDLVYGHSSGYVDDRDSWLGKVANGWFDYSLVDAQPASAIDLGGGIVGSGNLRIEARIDGVERAMDLIYQTVWRRETAGWKFVAHSATLRTAAVG